MYRLIVRHAKQVVQVCGNSELMLCGDQMKSIVILQQQEEYKEVSTDGFSLIVDHTGHIVDIGKDKDIEAKYKSVKFQQEIDASGKCILPGLIDGHTHPVWEGDRVHEFAMKLDGASYMDIHKAGGGINFTVSQVHQATEDMLYKSLLKRIKKMVKCGTTTLEAKSGYGLNLENEVKMLRVIDRAKRELSIVDISLTYCGAHAIPKNMTMEAATNDIIDVQIPEIKRLMDVGEINVDNIDVFCEKGVFDAHSTRRILKAGKSIGLAINFHGDELHPMESGQLGASLDAKAISHLEEVSEAGIKAMAEKKVVGVLLPTTAYILKLKPPPAREMINSGVPVALGSDFNPNAFCYSMPIVMHMACCILRMSMAEALAAATINAAASLGLSHTHGSLEVGKVGDLLIIDAPRWEHLIYQFGAHDQVIDYVIKKGNVVYQKPTVE